MSTSPLIGADELRASLGVPTVLDVRYRLGLPPAERRAQHAAGHVPGAAYVDVDDDLSGPPGGDAGRHPLPDPDHFSAAMRAAGVSAARPVVVYDDWGGRAAARAWWLLRHHGHGDVRVLDGGWPAWTGAGGPVATGLVGPGQRDLRGDLRADLRGDFQADGPGLPVLGHADVGGATVLIDARAPERFRGEVEPVDPVAGHIPTAVNVPTDANLGPDGRFRPAAELAALYAAVGAVPGTEVGAYCGSGVTACHDLLALEVAGVPGALYPGSWSGWVHGGHRPVETGPAGSAG